MIRHLLLWAFVGLMADRMFGWQMNLAPGVSLKNALLYSILLLIGLQAARRRQRVVIDLPPVHLFFGLLILIAFLSWAANVLVGMYVDYPALPGLMTWKSEPLDHYLFFLLFFLGVRSEQEFLWLQKWILFFVAMASVATVLDAYDMPDLGFIDTRHDGRVQGPLGQANDYGIFLATFLPIILARVFTETGAWRGYFAVGAAATAWALLLTVSRGSYLSLILGSICSAYMLRQHLNPRMVRRFVAMAVLALLGAVLVLGDQYIELILERTIKTAETGDAFQMTSGRLWIWSRALDIMVDSPLSFITGYGWNTTTYVLGITMHSRYMNYLFELGIFGLMTFMALLTSVMYWTRRAIIEGRADHQLRPALVGFCFGFMTLCFGLIGGNVYSPWYFVWAYTGIALRAAVLVLQQTTGPRTEELPGTGSGARAGPDMFRSEPRVS